MQAISISKSVRDFLARPRSGTLIATFEHSCYLELDGRIVALVIPPLLNGPLNIVVGSPEDPPFQHWRIGMRAWSDSKVLRLEDGIGIHLAPTRVWDATIVPWDGLDEERLWTSLDVVRATLLQEAPQGSFAHYLPGYGEPDTSPDPLRQRAHDGLTQLQVGLRERVQRDVAAAARKLAGLGSGLTPSGDDVLVGALVALTVSARNDVVDFHRVIVEAASGHTTRISEAYVEAAARGEANEAWHRLLDACVGADGAHVAASARLVMAFGETSGADMLAGFLLAMEALFKTN